MHLKYQMPNLDIHKQTERMSLVSLLVQCFHISDGEWGGILARLLSWLGYCGSAMMIASRPNSSVPIADVNGFGSINIVDCH